VGRSKAVLGLVSDIVERFRRFAALGLLGLAMLVLRTFVLLRPSEQVGFGRRYTSVIFLRAQNRSVEFGTVKRPIALKRFDAPTRC
jgi:hypothetical protein